MKTLDDKYYKAVNILQANGFSKTDAEMVTEAFTAIDVSELANKKDIKELELRMVKWSVGIQVAQTGVTAGVLLGLLRLYLG